MNTLNLSDFQIQAVRGYLPENDPLETLSNEYVIWDKLINQLPEFIKNGDVGNQVDSMPLLYDVNLQDHELGRAKLILGMLAQAYVWEPKFRDNQAEARQQLPAQLALPLIAVSEKLDEPPIFNYADYVLRNWKAIDRNKPLTIDNLTTLATFSNRDDEKMFVVVHVAYEYIAGRSLELGEQAMGAADMQDTIKLTGILIEMATILKAMKETFLSVKNVVSPDIFRNYIRLFLKGWKNNTAVAYADIPASKTQYRGETGSQSSVIPFFDALFGVFYDYQNTSPIPGSINQNRQHDQTRSAVEEYLDFRNYMPLGHRNFIRFVEHTSRIRNVVLNHSDNAELINAYNECIAGIAGMRHGHKSTVNPYIGKPGQLGNLGYGTGGSDYQQYLGALLHITESSKIAFSPALKESTS